MNNLKNYSKPVMQMEQFVPQEFIAACWICELYCEGSQRDSKGHLQMYVFNGNPPTGSFLNPTMGEHLGHPVATFITTTSSPEIKPSVLDLSETIDDRPGVVASQSAVATGQGTFVGGKEDQWRGGYTWPSVGDWAQYGWCFATTIEWNLKGAGDGINAS